MKDDIEWLHRFLNASVFGPPPSEIQRAHRIVDALTASRPEGRKSMDIAFCPACEKEWDAGDAAPQSIQKENP